LRASASQAGGASPATRARINAVEAETAHHTDELHRAAANIQAARGESQSELAQLRADLAEMRASLATVTRECSQALAAASRARDELRDASAASARYPSHSASPAPSDGSIADEVRRQRLDTAPTFESHGARLPDEFSAAERAVLQGLPRYTWRKDDADTFTLKRALHKLLANLAAVKADGSDKFVANLRLQMQLLNRTLTPADASFVQLLAATADSEMKAFFLAELALIGEREFDANIVDRLRMARVVPTSDAKAELQNWRAGKTQIPDTPLPTQARASHQKPPKPTPEPPKKQPAADTPGAKAPAPAPGKKGF
jgi:hypothetical protein